jgi:hypothetical protein
MDSRQSRRVGVIGVCLLCAFTAHAQLAPSTTTSTISTTTTTVLQVQTNVPTRASDAVSVTVSQSTVTDVETMRLRLAKGGPLSAALVSTGLFKSANLLSTTDSVITSQAAGCETNSSRQFFYVQPETRLRNVDPFLIEAQVTNIRPMDSRCSTNRIDVVMKGPFKTYQKVRSAGSSRDNKLRNFFEIAMAHDAATSQLTFKIANEGYQEFLKKLQLGGILSPSSALNNSAVLTVVGPKLQSVLVGINGGGLQ